MGLAASATRYSNTEKQSTKSYSDLYSIDSSYADLEPVKQKSSLKPFRQVSNFDESIIDDLQTTDVKKQAQRYRSLLDSVMPVFEDPDFKPTHKSIGLSIEEPVIWQRASEILKVK